MPHPGAAVRREVVSAAVGVRNSFSIPGFSASSAGGSHIGHDLGGQLAIMQSSPSTAQCGGNEYTQAIKEKAMINVPALSAF